MGLFRKKQQNGEDRAVWRNDKGVIECPGDNCPKQCNETCPIFINTEAATCIMQGNELKAIPLYEKALAIAPDFYDAWNNLGAIYGGQSQYQKAYDCYLKAHNISPTRPAPVFGLALSSRDMKKYADCIKWCDAYDRIAHDHRLDDARKVAEAGIKKTADRKENTQVSLTIKLIHKGYIEGFITYDNNFPNIPEIMMQSRTVSLNVLREMFDARYNDLDYLKKLTAALRFCFYCGTGAVAKWNDDWDSLKRNGIIKTLSAPRGFDYIDEYVMDYIGLKWDSSDEMKLRKHLFICIDDIVSDLSTYEEDKFTDNLTLYLMAMFNYGMIMEMDRLGMH